MKMGIGSNPYCFADVTYEAMNRVGPGLTASPVPVVHHLHQADVSPVVVVVADPGGLVLLAAD